MIMNLNTYMIYLDQIFEMANGWNPICQQVLIMGTFLGSLIFVERMSFLSVVLLRGWPRQKI
jgi:hypothetical protein